MWVRRMTVPEVDQPAARIADLLLLARMAGLGVVNEVLLRAVSLPRQLGLLRTNGARLERHLWSGTVARHVTLARRLFRGGSRRGPFRRSCLRQSLVLFRTLRRAGVPVTIQFGVAPKREGIDGHCWLELEGQPIAEREARQPRAEYRTIVSFPEVS